MDKLEASVRAIEMDGLVWGASKLVPSAFKINKLQINIVVEDDKVSTDELQAQIEEDEDHVQSTDVVSDLIFSIGIDCDTDGFFLSRLLCRSSDRVEMPCYEEWYDDGYFLMSATQFIVMNSRNN